MTQQSLTYLKLADSERNFQGWNIHLLFCQHLCFRCHLVKLSLVWHKARSMKHPLRIELTNNGLLAYLSNYYIN